MLDRDSDGWLGKYDLIAELPREGVEDAYLAAVVAPGGYARLAILRMPRADLAADAGLAAKFVATARTGVLLNHANIVETYEVSHPTPGGRAFAATEYVEGQTLARVVERIGATEMGRGMWLRILVDVLAALHHAHEAVDDGGAPLRLAHLHLSPASALVTYDGQVKLTDVGRLYVEDPSEKGRASRLPYLAPEQVRGEPTDRATDVFAVGAMLWEACTRVPMWPGSAAEALAQLADGRIPSLRKADPAVPPALADIIGRALSPKPDDRYSTAMHMQTDLEGFLRASGDWPSPREIGKVVAHAFLEERLRTTTVVDEQLRRLRARSFSTDGDQPLSLLRLEALSPSGPIRLRDASREMTTLPRPITPGPALPHSDAEGLTPPPHHRMLWFALGVGLVVLVAVVVRYLR